MPELPEVEAAARVLRAAIVGRRIVALQCLHPATCRSITDVERAAIARHRVAEVVRRGKHQLIVLDDGTVLHVHFRMNGDWDVGRASHPRERFARAELTFDDGLRVSLVDSRALATIAIHESMDAALPPLGPEPTDASFSGTVLRDALRTRRAPIKPVLLDQRVVSGVGNIYAAEALWEARIDPRAPANRISRARVERLAAALRATLERALVEPGRYSTGETRDSMHVYGRAGESCDRCGATIRRIEQAGRSTYYCPRCQAR